METKKIISSLRASSGRPMRVAFSDGVVQTVMIGTIDYEGFLHRDPDGADPQVFWTRCEDVDAQEQLLQGFWGKRMPLCGRNSADAI